MRNPIKYCMRKIRKLQSQATVSAFASAEWMRVLRESQQLISTSNKHPHYLAAYREAELFYWVHLPKWIYEARMSHAVSSCLDIGCAYGTLALYCKLLLGCDTYGIDFTEQFFTQALTKTHGIHFSICNFEVDNLPWQASYDLIIFTEVLEHFNFSHRHSLERMRDLLSPHGRIYLSTPDASQHGRVTKYYPSYREMPAPTPGHPVIDDHVYVFTKQELADIIRDAGLQISKFAYAPGSEGRRHFNLVLVKL